MWRRDEARPADPAKQEKPAAQSATKDDSHKTVRQEGDQPKTSAGKDETPKSNEAVVKRQPTTPQDSQPALQLWQPSAPLAIRIAPAEREEPPGHRIGQILEPALWMVGALLFSAIVLMLIQAWKKRSLAVRDGLNEQLTQFRDAYQQGKMSKEEYHRVHALLTGRLRERMRAEQLSQNPAAGSAVPPPKSDPASEEKPAQDNGQA